MKILGSLYKDASVSIPKLSKDLGLNLSVTYSRIKRLARRQIIKQFTIIVDEEKLGLPASAVVGLNLDPKQRDQALAEIAKLEQVRAIQEVTGRFDRVHHRAGQDDRGDLQDRGREPREGPGRQPGGDVRQG